MIGILLFAIAAIGFGCRSFFSNRTSKSRKVSGPVQIGSQWTEISPAPPLTATGKLQFVGLKINGLKPGAAAPDGKIPLGDGRSLKIEVQLIDENGNSLTLFPNGIGEFAEFGKRAQNKENVDDAYFEPGEKFTKIKIRSDQNLSVDEVIWSELEF